MNKMDWNQHGVLFKIWWMPQVPGPKLEVQVSSPEEGRKICDVLAEYDKFQYKHRIKPDYCNTGGVVYSHSYLTKGKYQDYPDDALEVAELKRELIEWYKAHMAGEAWAC